MSRKVFLNCGANKGNDILLFRKEFGDEYEIFAFEPEPRCFEYLEKIKDITHIKSAISTHDGKASFYEGKFTVSGSLRADKQTFMSGRTYEIDTIDFSKWLQENFTVDDEVVCLFNIEGGEYDILPKLFVDGSANLIKKFYIEFHLSRLRNMTEEYHRNLVKQTIEQWGKNCFIYQEHQSEEFVKISAEFWKK